jgi:PAS domain S-box-containing protein
VEDRAPSTIGSFMRAHRAELLKRWEREMRSLPTDRRLSRPALIDDLPDLLDRITAVAGALATGQTPSSPPKSDIHGRHRQRQGIALWEVVAELSILRECVMDLWTDTQGRSDGEMRALHRALDQAIMTSVESYVAERQRILRALQQEVEARALAERRIETLVSSHPDFFYLLDRDHRFLYISPSLLQLWGRSADEAVGKTFEELGYPPELVHKHEQQLNEVLAGHIVRGENLFTSPSGSTRAYEYIFVPVFGEDGSIDAIAGVTRDMTEKKAQGAALESAVASSEQLLAVLGHDLRTPLGAISMAAQTMLRARDLPEHHLRSLERIERSAQRMARLVSDIMDWTRERLGSGVPITPVRTDLAEICEQVITELETLHPQRAIRLERRGTAVGCWDFDRVAQLLQNLVANAITHGDPDAPVQVTIDASEDEGILEVHNEGKPITPDRFPGSSSRFESTHPRPEEGISGSGSTSCARS